MERIELYKNLKQAKLDEDRKKLLASIDHLLQEAELVKSQIEAGHAWETNLANRGRQVDDLRRASRTPWAPSPCWRRSRTARSRR